MSETIRVAVAQFVSSGDKRQNLAEVTALAELAASRGAALVVFPEYSSFFEPRLGASFVEAAEPLDGPFVKALQSVAARLGLFLVAGMAEEASATRFSNTLVAVSPGAEIVATYRKVHLYDAFGARESDWVQPGPLDAPQLFDVGGFAVGMQTCFDVRFPESTRILVDAGAELVTLPAQWVPGPLKEHHWRTLVTARALENTVYVAAADQAPPGGIGNSLIVDPSGVVIAAVGDEIGIATSDVERRRLESVRQVNPVLRLRRFI